MNFPHLSSLAYFWWLLALSIPVLIHLLNRRRHRVVKWAAMEFLLRATRESRGRKKLKHIIILTCRALAVAALVFAVARPLSSSGFLNWGGGKLDTIIFILDRSPSMEQKSSDSTTSKREAAIALVKNSAAQLDGTKLILLDSATAQPIEIADPNSLDKISQSLPTDAAANIPSLLDKALQHILSKDTGRTEIWLASDLQSSNWQPASGKWNNIRAGFGNLADQASLRVLSLNSTATNNLSITLDKALRIDDELSLELTITQSPPARKQSIPLTLSLNGSQSSEDVTIQGETVRISKRLPLSGPSGFGYIQLPADTNPQDNTVYFTYGDEIPTYSAVVTTLPEARIYLKLAAAPPGYSKQEASAYSPNQEIPWNSLSTVLWQAPLPTGKTKEQALDFINKGGVIAFFPPETNDDSEFLDTKWGLLSKSAQGKYFIVPNWDRSDGPLRNGEDGTSIPVDKLKAIQRREILTPSSGLAKWSNDSPLITRHLHGRGACYFVATLPDYTWSNLGDADVILPLVQRLIQQGNERFGSGGSTTIGSLPAEIELSSAQRKRLDLATKSNSINAAFEAGVYQFGERSIAINRSPEEQSPEILERSDLDKALSEVKYSYFEDDTERTAALSEPLWELFLILMLVFLVAEAVLCLAPKRKNT
ncbi:BatA domain-containing protein [Rubritalea tangerina]|uniref:BatA domain-containing protein n=1 Tax=Rubritalea tangerina TaxID=430798 RepID=A0ABW4ZD45_9BACT